MIGELDHQFHAFVKASSKRLLAFAVFLTGDRGYGEDLLQTALLRVARRWRRIKGEPDAYARRVLINLAHDRRRTISRRPIEELGAGASLGEIAFDASDRVLERNTLIRETLRLPVRQRAVILLRYWEDLTVGETAQILRCSEGTVKSHTHRALAKLRASLSSSSDPPLVSDAFESARLRGKGFSC